MVGLQGLAMMSVRAYPSLPTTAISRSAQCSASSDWWLLRRVGLGTMMRGHSKRSASRMVPDPENMISSYSTGLESSRLTGMANDDTSAAYTLEGSASEHVLMDIVREGDCLDLEAARVSYDTQLGLEPVEVWSALDIQIGETMLF